MISREVVYWILFLLCVGFLLPLLLRPVPLGVFLVSVGVATFQSYTYYVTLPTPVFWILLVLLIPTLSVRASTGSILLYTLVIAHVHISAPDLTTSWLLPRVFWLSFVLIWPFLPLLQAEYLPPLYFSCVACWMTITFLLRDKIHFLMHIGYWIGWPFLFNILLFNLPPEMPISWHIFGLSFIGLTGSLIRPGISLARFFLWIGSIMFLLALSRRIYIFVYFYPEKYLFPYNLIGGYWKLRSPKWYPVGERSDSTVNICERCQCFTAKSKLIMGSNFPLVRLVEWHDFWDSFEDLSQSVLATDRPCQLCHLLLHSVGNNRRKEILWGQRWLWACFYRRFRKQSREQSSSVPTSKKIPDPSPPQAFRLRVKIWEDRPLTRYTFTQLYRGDMAIGHRLLIHRGKLFAEPSMASRAASTGSDAHIIQANRWMQDCKKHHKLCNGVGNAPRSPPTRLLHITPATLPSPPDHPPLVRITPTGPSDADTEYLAFSHCWGGSNPFKLVQANYDSCLQNIEFSKLSKNMQDAVLITRNLGFSYLWIDCLCIIQDSTEDWLAEADRMCDVYSGAACTIASTGSATSDGGCFHERDPVSLRSCEIGVSSCDALLPERIYVRRDDLSDFRRSVDQSPLNKRGWVLQERLLSRRILHFGVEMIYWECCQRAASELNPTGYIYKRYPDEFYGNFIPAPIPVDPDDIEPELKMWSRTEMTRRRILVPDFDTDDRSRTIWQDDRGFWKEVRRHSRLSWRCDKIDSRFRSALDTLENGHVENQSAMFSFSQSWYEIVELYTRTQLTFPKDKLIAISSITQRMQRFTGYDYVAGLWKQHLVANLLWFTAEGPGHRLLQNSEEGDSRPTARMAPTWSWASLNGVVTLDLLPDNARRKVSGEILIAEYSAAVNRVTSDQPDEYQHALEGILKIEGPLCKVSKVESDENNNWFISVDGLDRRSARLFLDIVLSENDISTDPNLFCLSCLVLRKEVENTVLRRTKEEVQGLVVRRLEKRERLPDIYERVGFFTTSRMAKPSSDRKRLKKAPVELIHII